MNGCLGAGRCRSCFQLDYSGDDLAIGVYPTHYTSVKALEDMDYLEEAPDLSGNVEIISYRAVFNGPYSSVYRGRLKQENQLVAIKVLNAIHGAALHTIQRKVKRERSTWSILRHPNILPLYGFADDMELFQPFGALISPWLQRGDLAQYLQEHGASAPLNERLTLWKGVVDGVNYLHLHNPILVHGDLKPRNVLIDDWGRAQICDFGLVRVYLEEGNTGMTTTTVHTGTERYLAYELFMAENDAVPTTASDIYATGCIGLEVIFLEIPYSNAGSNLRWYMLSEMQAGRSPATRPDDLDLSLDPLWDIVSCCWAHNPSLRPQAHVLSKCLEDMLNPAGLVEPLPPSFPIPTVEAQDQILRTRTNWEAAAPFASPPPSVEAQPSSPRPPPSREAPSPPTGRKSKVLSGLFVETYNLFFYGTLLHPAALKRLIGNSGSHLLISPAILEGYIRHRVKDRDLPAIITARESHEEFHTTPNPQKDCVRGSFVLGFTAAEKVMLDRYQSGVEFTPSSLLDITLLAETVGLDDIDIATLTERVPGGAEIARVVRGRVYIWDGPVSELDPGPWSFEDFVKTRKLDN